MADRFQKRIGIALRKINCYDRTDSFHMQKTPGGEKIMENINAAGRDAGRLTDRKEEIRFKAAFVAPDADLYGDITAGEDTSFWFHAVVRADDAAVTIGRGSNIQDNAVIHVDEGFPAAIGEDVTIGHGAVVHGCTIGDRTLIGMGAVILNGAVIGSDCVIGAGALVTGRTAVPDGSVLMGSPATVRRPVSEVEKAANLKNARHYVEEGKKYAAFFRKDR